MTGRCLNSYRHRRHRSEKRSCSSASPRSSWPGAAPSSEEGSPPIRGRERHDDCTTVAALCRRDASHGVILAPLSLGLPTATPYLKGVVTARSALATNRIHIQIVNMEHRLRSALAIRTRHDHVESVCVPIPSDVRRSGHGPSSWRMLLSRSRQEPASLETGFALVGVSCDDWLCRAGGGT